MIFTIFFNLKEKKIMYKYTNKKQVTPGIIHIVKNSNDFALLKEFNPEVIQVVYLLI